MTTCAQSIESLDELQANRYLAGRSEVLQTHVMALKDDRRRRRLQQLVAEFASLGGLEYIAHASGLSYAALEQIVKGTLLPAKKDGTRAPRSLGNSSAAAIEAAFQRPGYFDSSEGLSEEARELAEKFDALPANTAQAMELKKRLFYKVQGMLELPPLLLASAAPAPPAARPKPARAPRR